MGRRVVLIFAIIIFIILFVVSFLFISGGYLFSLIFPFSLFEGSLVFILSSLTVTIILVSVYLITISSITEDINSADFDDDWNDDDDWDEDDG